MKKLTIMRHGKAQSRDLGIPDRERVLENRGRKDSRRMGAFYAGMAPDLILCSPAKRAFETASLFAEGSDYQDKPQEEEKIYSAFTGENLLPVLREQEGDHLLIVGHNPAISGLISLLDGGVNPIIADVVCPDVSGTIHNGKVRLVTAATAHIVFRELNEWQDLQENSGQLRALLSPRFVKDL